MTNPAYTIPAAKLFLTLIPLHTSPP